MVLVCLSAEQITWSLLHPSRLPHSITLPTKWEYFGHRRVNWILSHATNSRAEWGTLHMEFSPPVLTYLLQPYALQVKFSCLVCCDGASLVIWDDPPTIKHLGLL